MGLQNQLSDVSSESILILTVVLIGNTLRYLRSLFLRALGVFSDSNHLHFYDVVGPGLAGVILLCDQLCLNRVCSYKNQSASSDCVVCLDRFAEGDTVRKLACRHVFHKDCFDGWLHQMNLSCPLCRTPLVSEERVDRTRKRVAGDVLDWFAFQ